MAEQDDNSFLQEQFGTFYEQLKEIPAFQAAQHAKEQVTRYIQQHPIQTTLIALGVGFVLGLLFSSRKSE